MLRITNGGGAERTRPLVELYDAVGMAGGTPRVLQTGPAWMGFAGTDQFFGAAITGVSLADAGNGVIAWRMPSAVNSVLGRIASWMAYPLNRNHALAPLVPVAARIYRRFTFEALVWRNAITPLVQYSVGIRSGSGAITEGGVGIVGFELYSIAALNAGAWTVRYRLVSGGPAVTSINTGVSPLIPVMMRFRFTEGPESSLEISIDNLVLFTATGPAALPTFAAGTLSGWFPNFVQGVSIGGAVGATDWLAMAHATIEEL